MSPVDLVRLEELIEEWSFEDMETQKKVCANVRKIDGLWSDSEEDCYTMGYETGCRRMYKYLTTTKDLK